MKKVGVFYYSGKGHTKKLAESIKIGVESISGIESLLINVANSDSMDWGIIHSLDGLIFGSPTYMGSVAGEFKKFMDSTSKFWLDQTWKNKISAGFTIGTSPGGDQLNTLIQLFIFSMQHGMIWVGQDQLGSRYSNDGNRINDSGAWIGLTAQSNPDKSKLIFEYDEKTALLFGKRIGSVCSQQSKNNI